MKAYKVVVKNEFRDSSDRFFWDKKFDKDSLVSIRGSDLTIEYKLNEKAFPEIGKLFVFKNLERAKICLSNIQNEQTFFVFEGEVENCRRIFRVCSYMRDYFTFWEAKKNHKNPRNYVITGPAPQGSYVCDSFTPTKIVSMWKGGKEI